MALSPYKIDGFGKLDLVSDPEEGDATRCLDMLNVEQPPGRVETRNGYDNYTSSAYNLRFRYLTPYRFGATDFVVASTDSTSGSFNELVAYNAGGTVITSANTGVIALSRGAQFGTSSNTYVYVPHTVSPARFDGTTISIAPAGLQPAGYYAVQANDNRLVAAYHATDEHKVSFSDPGAPETTGASNYVRITPGDGEFISGCVAWRNLVFVCKNTKFAVFYGNSTDATGNPIFNYRMVDVGIGADTYDGTWGGGAVCAGRPGVFMFNRRGVYLTTGEEPQLISRAIDSLFTGDLPAGYAGSAINRDQVHLVDMCWSGERLYVAVPTGSSTYNDRLLVWDYLTDSWLIWDIPAAAVCDAHTGGTVGELHFAYATGSNHIGRVSSSFTTDDGSTISWRWQSGWYDPSGQNLESATRYSTLRGQGTVSLEVLNDYATTGWSGAQSVTLGTAPTSDEGYANAQGRGVLYAHKLSGTGAAQVDSLTHWLSRVRTTGLRSG